MGICLRFLRHRIPTRAGAPHQAGPWYTGQDLSLRDHRFAVPLDHSCPSARHIAVFVRGPGGVLLRLALPRRVHLRQAEAVRAGLQHRADRRERSRGARLQGLLLQLVFLHHGRQPHHHRVGLELRPRQRELAARVQDPRRRHGARSCGLPVRDQDLPLLSSGKERRPACAARRTACRRDGSILALPMVFKII